MPQYAYIAPLALVAQPVAPLLSMNASYCSALKVSTKVPMGPCKVSTFHQIQDFKILDHVDRMDMMLATMSHIQ